MLRERLREEGDRTGTGDGELWFISNSSEGVDSVMRKYKKIIIFSFEKNIFEKTRGEVKCHAVVA